MKKIVSLIFLTTFIFSSCSEDADTEQKKVNITFKFIHNWNGTPITQSDFNDFKFTNENGEKISIQRLRYIVSDFSFGVDGPLVASYKPYHFIDLGENKGLTIEEKEINPRDFSFFFRFGFTDIANQDGIYQDLNSISFNVPSMLGGGYHFMQFDGKYLETNNAEANFNYHTIRAVDRTDPNSLVFEDTSFLVDLGNITITNDAIIEIKINIAEWFKNPNTWDLNQLNTVLMPNFDAQILMNQNGKSVFSLGEITQ